MTRSKQITVKRRERAREMVKSGMSQRKIAKALGVSRALISRDVVGTKRATLAHIPTPDDDGIVGAWSAEARIKMDARFVAALQRAMTAEIAADCARCANTKRRA